MLRRCGYSNEMQVTFLRSTEKETDNEDIRLAARWESSLAERIGHGNAKGNLHCREDVEEGQCSIGFWKARLDMPKGSGHKRGAD